MSDIFAGLSSFSNDDITDHTKEVDENGNPLQDEDQKSSRKDDPDDWDTIWCNNGKHLNQGIATHGGLVVEDISHPWREKTDRIPYCPVYVSEKENGGKRFTAYVTGQILDVNEYIDLIEALEIATEKDTITIFIDSPGGYISSGSHIASMIHDTKAETIGIATGLCASAGSLILSACERIVIYDTALMMYHMSSHFDYGNSRGIADRAANQVYYVNECLLSRALLRGHITEEEYKRIQGGEDVFIAPAEFRKRLTKDRRGADYKDNNESVSS